MKAFAILGLVLVFLWVCFTPLHSGITTNSVDPRDIEIVRLRNALADQKATREADIDFGEKQVSMYLGCKRFLNSCSKETELRGQVLLKEGFTGTTSGWYWLGFFGEFASIGLVLSISLSVFWTIFSFLRLMCIEPKREDVEQKTRLIETANARARVANLRANELEYSIGILRKELHHVTHPKKVRAMTADRMTAIVEVLKFVEPPVRPNQQENLDDY